MSEPEPIPEQLHRVWKSAHHAITPKSRRRAAIVVGATIPLAIGAFILVATQLEDMSFLQPLGYIFVSLALVYQSLHLMRAQELIRHVTDAP